MDFIVGTSHPGGFLLQSFQPPDLAVHHSTARDHNADCNITVGTLMLFTMHLHPTMEPTLCALRTTRRTGTSQPGCSTAVLHMAVYCTMVFYYQSGWPFFLLLTISLSVIAQHFIQPKSEVDQNVSLHMVLLDSNAPPIHPFYAIDNGLDSLPPIALKSAVYVWLWNARATTLRSNKAKTFSRTSFIRHILSCSL